MGEGFNKIFSIENIIKGAVLLLTASSFYFRLESRIAILEDRSVQMSEIKSDIKEIQSDIKKILREEHIK